MAGWLVGARGRCGRVGPLRVDGVLAVSRSLGDFAFKDPTLPAARQKVTAEPEVRWYRRDATDEILVLACDGVWDVLTNHAVCEFIRKLDLAQDETPAAEALAVECLRRGSRDNITAIIVTFPTAHAISPE
jgi:serine/threonine protein phosphatase PrpC